MKQNKKTKIKQYTDPFTDDYKIQRNNKIGHKVFVLGQAEHDVGF